VDHGCAVEAKRKGGERGNEGRKEQCSIFNAQGSILKAGAGYLFSAHRSDSVGGFLLLLLASSFFATETGDSEVHGEDPFLTFEF
jgi:hypothetical protein